MLAAARSHGPANQLREIVLAMISIMIPCLTLRLWVRALIELSHSSDDCFHYVRPRAECVKLQPSRPCGISFACCRTLGQDTSLVSWPINWAAETMFIFVKPLHLLTQGKIELQQRSLQNCGPREERELLENGRGFSQRERGRRLFCCARFGRSRPLAY